jgi:hypothetical protein
VVVAAAEITVVLSTKERSRQRPNQWCLSRVIQ